MTPRHRAEEFRRFLNRIDAEVLDNSSTHKTPSIQRWHKTADEILDSLAAYCQRINDSGH